MPSARTLLGALSAVATLATAGRVHAAELHGFIQAEALHSQASVDQLNQDDGQPLNEDRFLIRRGRIRVTESWRFVDALLETELNTVDALQVGLRQVEAGLTWTEHEWPFSPPLEGADPTPHHRVRLSAGVLRVPFGYEVGEQLDTARLFAERSQLAQAFVPGQFDAGVRLAGEHGWLRWAVAAMNGEPLGTRAFPLRDPNRAKDLLGRVVTHLEPLPKRLEVEVGLSGLVGWGFHAGTQATKDTIQWRDVNEDGLLQQSELQLVRGATATPSEDFLRFGVQLEARLVLHTEPLGRTELAGEAALASNLDRGVRPADPVLLGRAQRERGGWLALTQEFTPWVQAGLRVEQYEPDVDAQESLGGERIRVEDRFRALSAAIALRWERPEQPVKARLLLDATFRRDALALDASGHPSDLANDTVTGRLQVAF